MCDKKPFASSRLAAMELIYIATQKPHNSRRQERRMYFCRVCHAWHLTSHPLKGLAEDASRATIGQ